jgi:hypothetical protein
MYRTTRRNVLKAGVALGLTSLGWLGTLLPELRTARASQIPKARVDPVTGAKAAEAVDKILAAPHGQALSTHLTKLGFTRTHDDQVAAIQSDARGQDQLAYIWYSNAAGERARLLDLASNPKAGGITVMTGGGAHYLADSYRVADTGEVAHVEHGVLSGSHAMVTYLDTGETKSYDVGTVAPDAPSTATGSGPILNAEACWGSYCGSGCNWARGHACSVSCGLTAAFFCALCCWFNPPAGFACGIIWIFVCEYGWSCNSLSCCLLGLCCC